jgi:hypothetical protein
LDDGVSLFEICDYAQNTYDCGNAVFGFDRDHKAYFSPEVEQRFDLIPSTRNILLIDRMEIEPTYRGRMIGLITLIKLIRRYQKGCSLVVIKPFSPSVRRESHRTGGGI